jgi:hypothetical protein
MALNVFSGYGGWLGSSDREGLFESCMGLYVGFKNP